MASVPTGIPPGICTVAKSESSPFSASLFIGTPSTGSVVCAARTPAKCAAPPAAAITTSKPRDSAVEANSDASEGERCADITLHSCSTPNCVSVSSAWRIVSQSLLLPIITATSGLFPLFSGILFSLVQRETTLAVECIKTFSLDEIVTRVSNTTEQRNHLRMRDFAAVRLSQKTTAPVVRTKRFRVTAGPHLHTTITDHREFHTLAINFTKPIAEIVRRAFGPIKKNVYANHLF